MFNDGRAQQQEATRTARVQATTGAEITLGQVDEQSGRLAGKTDASGAWTAYGLLGWTPLGDFRVKG
ncbi:MAG TPA: hypothetical protein VFU47_07570 [Armatimonadota bacterium]|nr:hypothetical protein [Armatimonadota bacterium]